MICQLKEELWFPLSVVYDYGPFGCCKLTSNQNGLLPKVHYPSLPHI